MAVPAASISICSGFPSKAFIMTQVSSQSLRLVGVICPCAKACNIKARLLILLEAGSWTVVCKVAGAESL